MRNHLNSGKFRLNMTKGADEHIETGLGVKGGGGGRAPKVFRHPKGRL